MGEVEAGNRGGRGHGKVFGEVHVGVGRGVEQGEKRLLDPVIGAGRVAGGGTDALIGFADQRVVIQLLVAGVAQ